MAIQKHLMFRIYYFLKHWDLHNWIFFKLVKKGFCKNC